MRKSLLSLACVMFLLLGSLSANAKPTTSAPPTTDVNGFYFVEEVDDSLPISNPTGKSGTIIQYGGTGYISNYNTYSKTFRIGYNGITLVPSITPKMWATVYEDYGGNVSVYPDKFIVDSYGCSVDNKTATWSNSGNDYYRWITATGTGTATFTQSMTVQQAQSLQNSTGISISGVVSGATVGINNTTQLSLSRNYSATVTITYSLSTSFSTTARIDYIITGAGPSSWYSKMYY